ncbi:uncharacterized protein RJT21DRAFT_37566 [Scheffersomyces amazonensis]|uniref:uncharacterized protein n=1 Tax=Scheffersomyces amazonensis TaxID=1078765 RepID=UPI00315DEC0F
MSLLIGIDVGGTNTDSVLIDPKKTTESTKRGVLAWNKSTTTADVSDGIESAIDSLFKQVPEVDKSEILAVTIGTTHFINAVIEKDKARLEKVALLRLCGPYSRNSPPFADFPKGLKLILEGYVGLLDGGHYVHGDPVKPINKTEVLTHVEKIKELGLKAVALVGQFSPMVKDHEDEVAAIIAEEIPDVKIVKSYEVAGIGFLERENAAVLNAAILRFAKKVISSFNSAVSRRGLNCPVLLTQNDGTVVSSDVASKIPISTFSSGATNSMRGASFLCRNDESLKDRSVIVVDVGGTTTDVGLLLATGFPRQAATHSYVGGVRMNFSMPHVESIGLGGGTIVRNSNHNEKVTIGPDSVGNEILERSIVCGGDSITVSDVTFAYNQDSDIHFGNFDLVKERFSSCMIEETREGVKRMLETIIDRMRTSPEPLPVLLVGGGSFIVPTELEGASAVHRPPFYSVANAIGAAMSKISGTINLIKVLPAGTISKEDFLKQCIEDAKDIAQKRGALRDSTVVIEMSHDPIPYIADTFQFHVKVVGEVDYSNLKSAFVFEDTSISVESGGQIVKEVGEVIEDFSIDNINLKEYIPTINSNNEWIISEVDLEFFRIGTYILGCGGGGTPHPCFLDIRHLVRNGDTIRIIDMKDIKKYIKGEGTIIPVAFCGSPTVAVEQLKAQELLEATTALSNFTGRQPDLFFPLEIGGGQGFTGFEVGASSRMNIPIVDCDLMGRAYPTLWQTTCNACLDDYSFSPGAVSNSNGNSLIVSEIANNVLFERVVRIALTELGTFVGVISNPLSHRQVEQCAVANSLSLAWRIGRAVIQAKQESDIENLPSRIIDAVGGPQAGKRLMTGKIIDVFRKLHKGYVFGEVLIEEVGSKRQMVIPFKNENIYCKVKNDEEDPGEIVCSVPDLISVIEVDTGEAVGTPDYKYGLMVHVLGFAPSHQWTSTKKAFDIGGPESFEFYGVEYKPVGEYTKPVSVIEEFGKKP